MTFVEKLPDELNKMFSISFEWLCEDLELQANKAIKDHGHLLEKILTHLFLKPQCEISNFIK
jgi:hypothetical protein